MTKPNDDQVIPDGSELDQSQEAEESSGFDAASAADEHTAPKASEKAKEVVVQKEVEKPAEAAKEAKPADDKKVETVEVKTALEKAEAAASSVEAEEKPEDAKPAGDVFDNLPAEYHKYKADRENGKLVAFLKTQPKAIQNMAVRGEADDCQYVLDLYAKSLEAPSSSQASKEVKSFIHKFGDKTFTSADGTQKKLSELAESYGDPDLFEALALIAQEAASGKSQPVEQPKPDMSRIEMLEQKAAEREFWDGVTEAHPDAKALQKSGVLKEWILKQSASIQRLAGSPDPSHAILVIDAYKESIAKEANKESAAKAKEKKVNLNSLHGETGRGGRDVKAPSGSQGSKSKEEEENDGFEEGAK